MTHHLAKAQSDLPVRDDLKLVSISVDPVHDTPAALAKYAAENGADRSRWLFLTGEKSTVHRLSQETFKLGVDDSTDTIDHSSSSCWWIATARFAVTTMAWTWKT